MEVHDDELDDIQVTQPTREEAFVTVATAVLEQMRVAEEDQNVPVVRIPAILAAMARERAAALQRGEKPPDYLRLLRPDSPAFGAFRTMPRIWRVGVFGEHAVRADELEVENAALKAALEEAQRLLEATRAELARAFRAIDDRITADSWPDDEPRIRLRS